jgi:hypothetical protein
VFPALGHAGACTRGRRLRADKERLKEPANFGRIQELRRIIAEIRASDVNLYGELRQICTFAQDYDGKAKEWQNFYAHMRAKLYWAVTSRTPSMIMAERADADAPDMGLQSWAGDQIWQKDAISPASYLAEAEFRELNSVTVILLDVFSDQADLGKLATMGEAETLFNKQLQVLSRPVLKHGGGVSREDAEAHAKREYQKFDAKRRAANLGVELQAYMELKAEGKALPKARKVSPPQRAGSYPRIHQRRPAATPQTAFQRCVVPRWRVEWLHRGGALRAVFCIGWSSYLGGFIARLHILSYFN